MSEDSDIFPTEKYPPQEKRMSFANMVARQETTSTESKETLTPLDNERTLVDNTGSVENITDLNFEAAKQRALRRRSILRRNSDNNYDINRSQGSLNAMTRRQLSLTQSEPDSGNEQSKIHIFYKCNSCN